MGENQGLQIRMLTNPHGVLLTSFPLELRNNKKRNSQNGMVLFIFMEGLIKFLKSPSWRQKLQLIDELDISPKKEKLINFNSPTPHIVI